VEGAYVGTDPGDAIDVLEHLVDVLLDRQRKVRGDTIEEWRRKIQRGEEPAILLVIGEWASYLDRCKSKEQRSRFDRATRLIVANGRKLLLITSASTQKPSHEVIPTSVRDLFAYRLALRCTTPSMSDMILGDWTELGFDASKILPHQPGTGLLHVDGTKPRLVRACYLDDDDLRAVAARGADLRARYAAEQLGQPAPEPAPAAPDGNGSHLEQGVGGSEGLTASGRNVSLPGVSSDVKGVWTVDGDGGVEVSDAEGSAGGGAASGGGAGVPGPVDVDAPPVDDGVRVTGRLRRGRRRR
jgi:DNA segregation ATPase FtsK/SpoIIIE-like protein